MGPKRTLRVVLEGFLEEDILGLALKDGLDTPGAKGGGAQPRDFASSMCPVLPLPLATWPPHGVPGPSPPTHCPSHSGPPFQSLPCSLQSPGNFFHFGFFFFFLVFCSNLSLLLKEKSTENFR